MTHASDVMPQGRLKLIHTHGSVAKISFETRKPYRQALSGPARQGAFVFKLAHRHRGFSPHC